MKDGYRERETLSLGLKNNLCHKEESVNTVRTYLDQAGACIYLSDQEVLDMFDLIMSDRAKANETILEELDISYEDILYCNAHFSSHLNCC